MNVADAKSAVAGDLAIVHHAVALAAAVTLADEVDRLERQLQLVRAEIARVTVDYQQQLETVHELNAMLGGLSEHERRTIREAAR